MVMMPDVDCLMKLVVFLIVEMLLFTGAALRAWKTWRPAGIPPA